MGTEAMAFRVMVNNDVVEFEILNVKIQINDTLEMKLIKTNCVFFCYTYDAFWRTAGFKQKLRIGEDKALRNL